MPRRCTVCDHPQCGAIDQALVANGTGLRTISDRWSVSKTALLRHRQGHIPRRLLLARDTQEREESVSLLEALHRLETDARRLTRRAEEKDDIRTGLAGIQVQAKLVELRQKIEETQAIQERLQVLEAAVERRRIA